MLARRMVLSRGRVAPSLGISAPRFSSTAPGPVTIADRAFWRSLIPKPLRREKQARGAAAAATKTTTKTKKDWNPATYFIVMFLFIGSMSIQMLALRHQTERYVRQSSLRIAQLREVVERIQRGEEVDVEAVLGTGDAQREAEWEEVLQAIERDETMDKPRRQEAPDETKASSTPEPSPAKEGKPATFGSFF